MARLELECLVLVTSVKETVSKYPLFFQTQKSIRVHHYSVLKLNNMEVKDPAMVRHKAAAASAQIFYLLNREPRWIVFLFVRAPKYTTTGYEIESEGRISLVVFACLPVHMKHDHFRNNGKIR